MRHALATSALPGTWDHQPWIGAVRLQVLHFQPGKLAGPRACHGIDLHQQPEFLALLVSRSNDLANHVIGQDDVPALLGIRDYSEPGFPGAPIRDALVMLSDEIESRLKHRAGSVDRGGGKRFSQPVAPAPQLSRG